ncbi:uncharacterized protein LOC117568619 [Drosophila albomicans]|uniref:Uncharacterized protein LOC117568619 n=1 Tax=Drosophila albomicans TaxID=7291 RepID=A0A6P8WSU0_DROAB|nr:uncharacterized protein LOC117568619 [Drosophila albomicans]
MGRQLRLVLLLVISLVGLHLSHSSALQPAPAAKAKLLNDDVASTELDSNELLDTETNKTVSTTPAPKPKAKHPVSDETLEDLIEAAKHNLALAEDPRFNKMLPDRVNSENATSIKNNTEENYEYDDDYDYEMENYDSSEEDESDNVVKETSTTTRTKKTKVVKTTTPKLHPIEESTTAKPKAKISKDVDGDTKENDIDASYDEYIDEDDDDDDDDADDSDDDDESDKIQDEEQVVFSENVPCPRYCTCSRNINSYLVATCSRLDLGTQKFGSDITDLVVTNVGPKYPIPLGPKFFQQLGLKFVASIKIANCTVQYMHADAFLGLDDLYAVNMTDVGLAVFNPDTFAHNKKLRMLTISGNDLSAVSSLHYLLKSSTIEELDLSRNNLMELNPTAFSKLSSIVYINLSQNNLQKIPEKLFESVDTIEELDLSYNSLKELPANLFNGTSMSILHLKYNTFTGDLHFGIKELQQVDLSFNSIVHVRHSMFDKMPGLTNLNLKGNGITKIQPDSFLTLKSLRHIDLSMNELDQVSSMLFFKNSELDVIRLNDNPRLSQLPTDGFLSYNGFFTVYYLDLSNCAVGALGHKTFSTMPHLTTLKLAWNNINNLPHDTFASLTKLIDLDLSNNLIVKLDELVFKENSELTKLNLAGNPITSLSMGLFLPLQQLRYLDVNDCELTSLSMFRDTGLAKDLKIFETLRGVNASGNLIKYVAAEDIKTFKNLRSLDLTQNPLYCNDDFQNFISYVSLHKVMSKKAPVLSSLDDVSLINIQYQMGWTQLAQEVCKHNGTISDKEFDLEKRIAETERKLKDDEDKLLSVLDKSVLDKNKLSNMQKIMKGSLSTENNKDNDSELLESGEEDLNNGGEDKEQDTDNDSEYEEDSEYEDDSDSDEDDDAKKSDKKKKSDAAFQKYMESVLKPKVYDGIKVEEIDLSKETKDKFLLDKLGSDSEEENSDEEDEEEIFIQRGHVYNMSYKYIAPTIIVVCCLLMILFGLFKIAAMVLHKRGERYRMAILASKNSFVYQKLSEDIVKPAVSKEPKQPKVHKYAPINQV